MTRWCLWVKCERCGGCARSRDEMLPSVAVIPTTPTPGSNIPPASMGRSGPLRGLLVNRAVLLQRVADAVHAPVDLLAIDDERRCEARDRAVRVLAQNAVLEKRFDELARGRELGRDLHPDQQTLAADFGDRRTLDR